MSELTHLSVRIPLQTREALDDIARKRRMTTGEEIRLAELVREALDEYVRRHKA